MIVLGLLLLAAAAAMVGGVVIGEPNAVRFDVLGTRFELTGLEVFLSGTLAGAMAALGLMFVIGAARRGIRRREELEMLREQRQDLEDQLQRERARRDTTGPTARTVPSAPAVGEWAPRTRTQPQG